MYIHFQGIVQNSKQESTMALQFSKLSTIQAKKI